MPVNLPPSIKDHPVRLIIWGWVLTLAIPVAIVIQLLANITHTAASGVNATAFLLGAVGVFGFPAGIVMLFVGYTKRHRARNK